jgi:hypothetical protein
LLPGDILSCPPFAVTILLPLRKFFSSTPSPPRGPARYAPDPISKKKKDGELAKLEQVRGSRPRRYCFYFDEEAEAQAQGLPYMLVPRVLSREEWEKKYCLPPGRDERFADIAGEFIRLSDLATASVTCAGSPCRI